MSVGASNFLLILLNPLVAQSQRASRQVIVHRRNALRIVVHPTSGKVRSAAVRVFPALVVSEGATGLATVEHIRLVVDRQTSALGGLRRAHAGAALSDAEGALVRWR